jgi:hypothetical protein
VFLIARCRVAEYGTWKRVFDEHVDARIRHGARGHRVFRNEEDENALTIMIEFTSRGGAEGLAENDISVMTAIDRSGVEGGPHGGEWQIEYLDEVDAADYAAWPYT